MGDYKYDPDNPKYKKIAGWIIFAISLSCSGSFIYDYSTTGCITFTGTSSTGYAGAKSCGPLSLILSLFMSSTFSFFALKDILKKSKL